MTKVPKYFEDANKILGIEKATLFPCMDQVAEVEHNLALAKRWRRCRLVKVGIACPCGKHVAVNLIDHVDGSIVAEGICPLEWRDTVSWIMNDRESWIRFRNSHPMEPFSWKEFVRRMNGGDE